MIFCEGYNISNIWLGAEISAALFTATYGYLLYCRPYQGAKKGKEVASSAKWGLGENVVFRLMECLTPTISVDMFKDNYFTSFCLLTHLGVNNIRHSSNRCAQEK